MLGFERQSKMSSHIAADVCTVEAVQLPPMTKRSAPSIVIMRYLQARVSVHDEMFISLEQVTFIPQVAAAIMATLLFLCIVQTK